MESEFTNVANIIKIFGLSAVSFIAAILWTPFLTRYLYKYQLWRKDVRDTAPDGTKTPLFAALHKDRETTVPRLGGVLIWVTAVSLALLLWILARYVDGSFWSKANFLSRNQTWLPLFTMIAASLLGLADDLFQVWEKGKYVAGGIRFRHRLLIVFFIALAGALWFYYKLDWRTIYIPGLGDIFIGIWYIPLFIGTMILLFSSGIVDGIDGLAGGGVAASLAAYGGI